MIMTPATKAKTFSRASLVRPSNKRATAAPKGSASPEKLASQKASHGRSGFAAMHGTVDAILFLFVWERLRYANEIGIETEMDSFVVRT